MFHLGRSLVHARAREPVNNDVGSARRIFVMIRLFIFLFLLCPTIANARPCADITTEILHNNDGTHSISGAFSSDELECVDKLDKEAEAYCAANNTYFYFLERTADIPNWRLLFKCITDKTKAEQQKKILEMPIGRE